MTTGIGNSSQRCHADAFGRNVLAPAFEHMTPQDDGVVTSTVDHLTNYKTMMTTIREDICDDGTISTKSGGEVRDAVARTLATVTAAGLGGKLCLMLGASAGLPGLALGLIGTGAMLYFAPQQAERFAAWGTDFLTNSLSRLGSFNRSDVEERGAASRVNR